MKRLIFLSFFLLTIVFLSACWKLSSSDTERQTVWSETGAVNSSGFFGEPKDANQVWEGLDRNLISRPLNFKECVEKNNNRPLSPDGKRGVQPPTSGSEIPWTYCYRDGISYHSTDKETIPEDPQYHPDPNTNSLVNTVLKNLPLEKKQQNTIIEMFALGTGNLKKIWTPNSLENKTKPPQFTIERVKGKKEWTLVRDHGLVLKDFNFDGSRYYRFENEGTNEHYDIWSTEAQDAAYDMIKRQQFFMRGMDKNLKFKLLKSIINGESWDEKFIPIATINFDKLQYEHFGYTEEQCIGSVCLDPRYPAYEYKWWILQKFENPEEESDFTILQHQDSGTAINVNNGLMATDIDIVIHSSIGTIQQSLNNGCLTNTVYQHIQWATWFQLSKALNIFWETYTLMPLNHYTTFGYGTSNEYWAIVHMPAPFESENEMIEYITKEIRESWVIYASYLVHFKDIPQLYIQYTNQNWRKNKQENPENIFPFSWNLKLDKAGNLIDLEQTRDIICTQLGQIYLGIELEDICWEKPDWWSPRRTLHDMVFFDEDKEKKLDTIIKEWRYSTDFKFNKKVLPLFSIKQAPIKGYYYLYPAKGQTFSNGGAGCKPVVYTYDKLKRENSLTVTLPEKSRFTKVIPDFEDQSRTWKFTTDEQSSISVHDQIFPYLYYSTLRPNYQNNTRWWSVAAEDIEFFLNNKLDKMNFNTKEKADFLEYWLPQFEKGYVYGISFKFDEEFEPYARLHFTHQPEKSFRVFMEAHQYAPTHHVSFNKNYPDANDKLLLRRFERGSDFDVLERGGKLEKLEKREPPLLQR